MHLLLKFAARLEVPIAEQGPCINRFGRHTVSAGTSLINIDLQITGPRQQVEAEALNEKVKYLDASPRAGVTTTPIAHWLPLLLASTLIMAAGWGIRGSFGHSRGAMMPGAMLGLTIAVCAMREEWWKRAAIIGFLSSIGWGFGGTSSYGLLIGYSMGGTTINSLYGYASLFLVGSLYCGIGAGFLALALTAKRSLLESAVAPMVVLYSVWLLLDFMGATEWSLERFAKNPDNPNQTPWLYDTLWLHACVATLLGALFIAFPRHKEVGGLIALLGFSWLASMFLLVGLTGFRINPSRGDAWAGCLGIQTGLAYFLWSRRNRAALLLTGYGLLAGGYGFAVGCFLQALGRGKWGPIGEFPVLQEFGYWTIMEQFFGGVMGAGMALGVLRLRRGRIVAPEEDVPPAAFNYLAAFVLLGMLFVFNSQTNIARLLKTDQIPHLTLGFDSHSVLIGVEIAVLGLLAFALWRVYQGKLHCYPQTEIARAQLLALVVVGMVVSLYLMLPGNALPTSLMIYGSLIVGGAMLVGAYNEPSPACREEMPSVGGELMNGALVNDRVWKLGWRHWLLWCFIPICLLALALATMQLEIPVRQFRFTSP